MSDPAPTIRWPEIYREQWGYVYRTVHRLGASSLHGEDQVRDLAQEVFVVVHRKLEGLRDPGRLRPWLFGICRRVVAQHRRKWKVRHALTDLWGPSMAEAQAPPSLEEAVAGRDVERKLYKLLDRLSDKRREVVTLFALEQLSGNEIAELLDIPVATVWTRLHAARTDLRKHIHDEGMGDVLTPMGAAP